MALEPGLLGGLLGLVNDGEGKRLAESFAPALLIGALPSDATARWSFRTLPALPRNARALDEAGLSLDMLCWPLRRPAIFRAGIRIGRSPSNDVVIPSESVSKLHAELTILGAQVQLRDCASANGTLLDGIKLAPMQPALVQPGAAITLGDVVLVFHTAQSLAELMRDRRKPLERG